MFIKNPTEGLVPKKPNANHKAKLRSNTYKAGHRLPVLSAAELLANKKRRFILEQVLQLSHLENEHYQATYAELINSFAEYVQIVPMHMAAHLGSLLNEGLGMGFASLHLHMYQSDAQSIKKTAPDPLLCFAIFSAGLLLHVARMAANQRIMLTTEDGSYLKTWNPTAGPLKEFGQYYKLRFVNDAYAGVHYALGVLLARQIMPPVAFEWLASDEQLFSEWLNALRGTTKLDGRVAAALDAAKEHHEFLGQLLYDLALDQAEVEQVNCPETEYGEAFYQWLINNVETNKLKINTSDAELHIVPQGVFIEAKIFKQFTDIYGASEISPNLVMVQFGNLIGITKKSGQDTVYSQYFSDYPETRGATNTSGSPLSAFSSATARSNQTRMGFVIRDNRLVFRQSAPPTMTSYMKPMDGEKLAPNLPNPSQPAPGSPYPKPDHY